MDSNTIAHAITVIVFYVNSATIGFIFGGAIAYAKFQHEHPNPYSS